MPGDYYVDYTSSCRQTAANYALAWSCDDGSLYTYDSYNGTQFNHYNPNDCQNFVSQCIWYGLGGRNSATKDLPMNADWWATVSTAANTWTSCSTFYGYVTNNHANNSYGVQGYSVNVSGVKIGDYIYDASSTGHVEFISGVIDSNGNGITDWPEIYICAHSANKRNHNLKALYQGVSSPPSYLTFVKIANYKWNDGSGF